MENLSVLKKIGLGILFGLLMVAFVLLLGKVLMLLWNFVIPDITGWKSISYLQALALLVLSKILFGGFGAGGGRGRHGWKNKWSGMSEEEKARLKERFKQSCRRD